MDLDVRRRRAVGSPASLDVTGLNLDHESCRQRAGARPDLRAGAWTATVDPRRRRLELDPLRGADRATWSGSCSGAVELAPGTFQFTDGTEMPMRAEDRARRAGAEACRAPSCWPASRPRSCRTCRASCMQGTFEADRAHQDRLRQPRGAELGGKVGIDGCQVLKAPEEVTGAGRPRVASSRWSRSPRRTECRRRGATELLAFPHRARQPGLRPLRADLAVPHQLDHDHRGQRLLQAPRLGHARVQDRPAPQPGSAAASGWAPRRSPCRW